MQRPADRRAAPSPSAGGERRTLADMTPSLVDLMQDGFYILYLLTSGSQPPDYETLTADVRGFLGEFERKARAAGAAGEDIEAARYAFCAAVDEVVIGSNFSIRTQWEAHPLQLLVFGDQLAGDNFYQRLELLRQHGRARLASLEVFHMCLLLGFHGKYRSGAGDGGAIGHELLLTRLGDEIARLKGRGHGFAPHAARPDQIAHTLRGDRTLWWLCALLGVMAAGAWGGLQLQLAQATRQQVDGYNNLVMQAPAPPTLTISLP